MYDAAVSSEWAESSWQGRDDLDRTSYQGEAVGVELPVTVDLVVRETEPGFAGNTQTGARKPGHDRDRPRGHRPDPSWRRAIRSGSTPGPGSIRRGYEER
jgi:hypothetical protein